MKTVEIYKAQGIVDAVESIRINLQKELPACGVLHKVFEKEAITLEDVLFTHLPGGVYDHVLAIMLKRKASQLVVRHKGGRE